MSRKRITRVTIEVHDNSIVFFFQLPKKWVVGLILLVIVFFFPELANIIRDIVSLIP